MRHGLVLAGFLALTACAPAGFAPTVVTDSPSSGPSAAASAFQTDEATPEAEATLLIPDPSPNEVARFTLGELAGFVGFGAVLAGDYTVEVGCRGEQQLGFRVSLDGAVVSEESVDCEGGTVTYVEAFSADGGEELEIAQVGEYPATAPGYIRVLHTG